MGPAIHAFQLPEVLFVAHATCWSIVPPNLSLETKDTTSRLAIVASEMVQVFGGIKAMVFPGEANVQ
jgi:hypothetical protein